MTSGEKGDESSMIVWKECKVLPFLKNKTLPDKVNTTVLHG